ncbi:MULTISPECIES: site-2 protease family protein [unclassified Desulfurobacterium]|uniref:site-2 protease family protein n=1 Tax=Desulfurobacterium sp. TC5-1 TaxID=1158318 RepID=UPI0003B3FFB6|nr:site-2 protease family protein [Desulfurobacterium sp. TC5-1]
MGDITPKIHGRLTLNPIAHIDPFGFIALLLVHFGWAKPVPVNPLLFRNVKNKRLGMLLVALAGPVANFISALLFLIFLKILTPLSIPQAVKLPLEIFLTWGTFINIGFGIFNLLPIPPLDGYRILEYFLPVETLIKIKKYEPYGMLILIAIIILPPFTSVFISMINGISMVMAKIVGINLF